MWVVIGYVIICCFWGLLLGLVWKTWKAVQKRRRTRTIVYGALAALLLWGGLEIGLVPGAGIYHRLCFTYKLFGTPLLLGNPSFTYHTERSFTGDGYSAEVYSLSESQVHHLLAKGEDFFVKRPANLSYRSHWRQIPWQRSPMKTEETKYLEFCSDWGGEDPESDERRVVELLAVMKMALAEPGCLYSYCYLGSRGEEGWPSDTDFFFVNPGTRMFVWINKQT